MCFFYNFVLFFCYVLLKFPYFGFSCGGVPCSDWSTHSFWMIVYIYIEKQKFTSHVGAHTVDDSEILNPLACIKKKPCKLWDRLLINWFRRISSINSVYWKIRSQIIDHTFMTSPTLNNLFVFFIAHVIFYAAGYPKSIQEYFDHWPHSSGKVRPKSLVHHLYRYLATRM